MSSESGYLHHHEHRRALKINASAKKGYDKVREITGMVHYFNRSEFNDYIDEDGNCGIEENVDYPTGLLDGQWFIGETGLFNVYFVIPSEGWMSHGELAGHGHTRSLLSKIDHDGYEYHHFLRRKSCRLMPMTYFVVFLNYVRQMLSSLND